MAAAANGVAFVQALQDATAAAAGLFAAGGPPVAQMQQVVQLAVQLAVQPLQQAQAQTTATLAEMQQAQAQTTATLAAMQQAQAQTNATLAALTAAVQRSETVAAKAYNGGCRDGGARPFVPVPNAAGVHAPAALLPLRNFAELRALNGAHVNAWCAHYNLAAPRALADRRSCVAVALGAVPVAGDLGM
jgi:hypothetical protein